jgi:hypothetical protein
VTPEGQVVRDVLDYLELSGVYAFRCNTGRRGGVAFGKVGLSDIIGIMPDGRFLAIECKRPDGGAMSDDQLAFLQEVAERGGLAIVARSVDDVVEGLKGER